MSQSFDEQLTRAFDSLSERLHAQIADQFLVTARHLAGAAESDRSTVADAAARDAAAAAEAQTTARLDAEFAARVEQLREVARAEGVGAGLTQARAEALASQDVRHAELRSSHEAALAAVRDEHDALVASLRAEYDADLADARAELEAARTQAHGSQVAAPPAAIPAPVTADVELVARLLHAVRALDAATSLSQTLDALAIAARAEAARVAIFLVRGATLRAWSHAGFDAMQGSPAFELPLTDAGIIADAVHSATAHRLGYGGAARPAFADTTPPDPFVAVPLTMNGQVIAVLCAEEASGTIDSLTTAFELLARHAARVLESLTALRLAQLTPSRGAGTTAPPPR